MLFFFCNNNVKLGNKSNNIFWYRKVSNFLIEVSLLCTSYLLVLAVAGVFWKGTFDVFKIIVKFKKTIEIHGFLKERVKNRIKKLTERKWENYRVDQKSVNIWPLFHCNKGQILTLFFGPPGSWILESKIQNVSKYCEV